MNKKPVLILLIAVLLFGLWALAARAESPPVKGTVYFLVHSGACLCQQEACRDAQPIAAFVQKHLAPGIDFKQLDLGERPETVEPMVRKYKIFTFPVFLAVDQDKKEVFLFQGKMRRDEVLKKLFAKGLITGVE